MICRSVWWIKSRKSRRSWRTPRSSLRKMQKYHRRLRKWTRSSKMWRSKNFLSLSKNVIGPHIVAKKIYCFVFSLLYFTKWACYHLICRYCIVLVFPQIIIVYLVFQLICTWLTCACSKNAVPPPGNKISSTSTLRPRRRSSPSWICRTLKCVRRLNTPRARTRNCRSSWKRTKKRCVGL